MSGSTQIQFSALQRHSLHYDELPFISALVSAVPPWPGTQFSPLGCFCMSYRYPERVGFDYNLSGLQLFTRAGMKRTGQLEDSARRTRCIFVTVVFSYSSSVKACPLTPNLTSGGDFEKPSFPQVKVIRERIAKRKGGLPNSENRVLISLLG